MSKYIKNYIVGKTHITCNTYNYPLIPVPDRKLKCITCNCVEHFRCPDVRCNILLCKKCADKYNKGLLNKVIKIVDTNDYPQAIILLQSPVVIPCPYPICYNDNDSDSESDSKDNSDSENNISGQ